MGANDVSLSERQLVKACLTGQPGSWQLFIDRYRPALLALVVNLLRRRGLNSACAEDIVQEFLLALCQQANQCLRRFMAGRGSLLNYLGSLAEKQAEWFLRDHGSLAGGAVSFGQNDTPDPGASDACLEARLHEFSDSLPPCEHKCFEEDFLGNRPRPETSAPQSPAARKRQERVRAKGRKFFDGP